MKIFKVQPTKFYGSRPTLLVPYPEPNQNRFLYSDPVFGFGSGFSRSGSIRSGFGLTFIPIPNCLYGPPAPGTLGCIVVGEDAVGNMYDMIAHSRSGGPRRLHALAVSYYVPYGEDDWCPHLNLLNGIDLKARNLTINMYYSYHVHVRNGV
uniref:Uncharacterized protein n=1 Tax=Lactuca sativa TaxID=4236 RepID=A0A9R1UUK4_LACSA|nr:hypothetical protein LSAT_V11C800425620 [Lactuca sativa]